MANIHTLKVLFFVATMLAFGFFFFSNPASAATITVNSNADTAVDSDGNCTFREAILNANDTLDVTGGDCATGGALGLDTIVFNDAYSITVTSNLPEINDPVVINGITGGNGVCSTKDLGVILNGGGYTGLTFNDGSDGSTVRGLVLKNFDGNQSAITIESGSDNHTISCNIIGLSETGLAVAANDTGIRSYGSNITIGGSSEGDGNVISGNTNDGIILHDGSTISILGNIIGLGADGATTFVAQNSGIKIDANGTTVSDVQIGDSGEFERNIISGNSFDENSNGIFFWDGTISDVTIQNNYIGTDSTGLIAKSNSSGGIGVCGDDGCPGFATTMTNLVIGGGNAGEGNIISGNGQHGINILDVDGLVIKGNKFGLGADGETAIANGTEGIKVVRGSNATLGGTSTGERNIISGNGAHGAEFLGTDTVVIYNNYIGTNEDGTAIVTNTGKGLIIDDAASNVTIGGTAAGERNVIAGEAGEDTDNHGISINDSSNVALVGNYIGTLADGTTVAQLDNGISVISVSGLTVTSNIIANTLSFGFLAIGSTTATLEDNTIINNDDVGVWAYTTGLFPGTPLVALVSNAIYGNGFGIDLAKDLDDDGVPETDGLAQNTNDSGDSDSGPNNYLNHPVMGTATQSGTNTVVTYSLDVPVSANPYRVEFFSNPSGLDASGYGQGETYLDSAEVTVSSSGSQSFSKTLTGITASNHITATVTNCTNAGCTTYGGTSEFSNPTTIGTSSNSSSGGGRIVTCKDPKALNYKRFGRHKQSLCKYEKKITTPESSKVSKKFSPISYTRLLKSGHKGADIQELQIRLNKLGFFVAESGPGSPGFETEFFGMLTRLAVIKFQKENRLVPDGIVGPKTLEKLNSY